MASEYKLVPEPIPGLGNVYDAILKEFASGGADSARVEMAARRPGTIQIGLSKARSANAEYKLIKVVRRGDVIYLSKK